MKSLSVSPSGRRAVAWPQILLLCGLIAVAAWLWTAPMRAERALKTAPLKDLIARSKTDKDNPRVFFYLGQHLRDLGQLGPARAAFARAGALDPDDETTLLSWADTAAAFGQPQEAYSVYSQAVKSHPESAKAHMALALFCDTHFAVQKAYDEARAAARCDPHDAHAWRLVGVSGMQLQYYPESEKALRKAVAIAPADWRSQLALAQVLTTQQRGDEAMPYYLAASRLAPTEAGVTLALGTAQLAQAHGASDLQTARETLTRAAIQAPESGPAQLALGQADVKLGLWDDALRALQVAERLVPNEADVHFELARIYRHAGDLPKAQRETRLHDTLKSYAEEKLSLGAQARTSGNPTVRLKLARLLADHGEVPQAIAEYRGILNQTPNLSAARSELNALETRQATGSAGADAGSEPETATPSPTGASSSASIAELVRDADDVLAHHRYEAAEQAYMNILARDPNQPRATEGLGLALLNEGKNELAFKALDHAVTLDPSLSVAQYNLAHMYYNDGFLDEARRRMEPLVAKEPNNAEYLHALGMCILTESSEYLRAEQLLKHAATVDPQNPAYQRDLAKAEENLSHFPEAEQAYRKALAVLPDDPTLLASFGTFLIDHAPDATRQQEAETMLRKAVALQPKNANALLALGRIALVRHDTKEALTDLKAAVSDDPNLQAAWLHLGHAFEMVGDKQRAADCRKAFQDIVHYRRDLVNTEEQAILHPEKADVRLKLARLYSVGGQNALAINQYKVCLSLNHNDPGVQKELQVYVDRLKKSGQLPSLEILNRMVLASAKAHR